MKETEKFGSHYSRICHVANMTKGQPRLFEGLSDTELKSIHIVIEVELEYRGLLKEQISPTVPNILEEILREQS